MIWITQSHSCLLAMWQSQTTSPKEKFEIKLEAGCITFGVHGSCWQHVTAAAVNASGSESSSFPQMKRKWSDIKVKCQEVQICLPVKHPCHRCGSEDTSVRNWRLPHQEETLVCVFYTHFILKKAVNFVWEFGLIYLSTQVSTFTSQLIN